MVNNAACSVIKNTIPRGLGKNSYTNEITHSSPPPPQKKEIPRDIVFIPSIQ